MEEEQEPKVKAWRKILCWIVGFLGYLAVFAGGILIGLVLGVILNQS